MHWALIRSGNLPVSAPQALLLQYLFTPNSHFKNLFSPPSFGSVSSLPLQSIPQISLPYMSMGDINASNSLIVSLMFSLKWFPISFRSLNRAFRRAFFNSCLARVKFFLGKSTFLRCRNFKHY